jgi:hydrogenase maturation factor HypF (carbamoyltransferase family)
MTSRRAISAAKSICGRPCATPRPIVGTASLSAAIAAAFHNTMAAATADVVRGSGRTFGALPIVATGGCFQNARLAEGIEAALAPRASGAVPARECRREMGASRSVRR